VLLKERVFTAVLHKGGFVLRLFNAISLKTRIFLYTVLPVACILILVLSAGMLSINEKTMQIAQNRVNESSLHAELKIESELMRFTTICKVLAEGIETLDDVKYTQEIPFYKNQFEKLFSQNTDLLSLFYIKEKSFNQTGFDYFSFERVGSDVVFSNELDFEPEIKEFYHDTMLNAKASISEPATYRFSVSQGRRIQQVIITTPIFKNGIFNGIVGLTISLAELNRICSEATALKDSFTFIVTKKG